MLRIAPLGNGRPLAAPPQAYTTTLQRRQAKCPFHHQRPNRLL